MTQNPVAGDRSQHLAELFENTDSLVETVTTFLSEGLTRGEAALVIMRLAQWNLVAEELTSRKISLTDAIGTGQLRVLDGSRTLERILLHGAPCRGLFEEVVGKTVRQLCHGGSRLRVYGDMVDTLAGDGNFLGARDLEKMWSDLAGREPITVLCGYSAATFSHPDARDKFTSICRSHTDAESNRRPLMPMTAAVLDQRT